MKPLPHNLIKYSCISSFEQLLEFMNLVDADGQHGKLTHQEKNYIKKTCQDYYKNNINILNEEQILQVYEHSFFQQYNNHSHLIIISHINNARVVNIELLTKMMKIDNYFIKKIGHQEISSYLDLMVSKSLYEQVELICFSFNKSDHYNFLGLLSRNMNNIHLVDLLMKYIPQSLIINWNIASIDTIITHLENNESSVSYCLESNITSNLFQKQCPTIIVQFLLNCACKLYLKDTNSDIFIKYTKLFGKDFISTLPSEINIESILSKRYIIDLNSTIVENYTTHFNNFTSRKLEINILQYIFLTIRPTLNENQSHLNLSHFINKYFYLFKEPVIEIDNSIEFYSDIIDFSFHNAQFNNIFRYLHSSLTLLNTNEHHIVASIVIKEANGKDNYLTNQWIQETIRNIPKEFLHIYQNRLSLINDKNEEINRILLSALHAVTLQHNLIEKNILNIVKTKI